MIIDPSFSLKQGTIQTIIVHTKTTWNLLGVLVSSSETHLALRHHFHFVAYTLLNLLQCEIGSHLNGSGGSSQIMDDHSEEPISVIKFVL